MPAIPTFTFNNPQNVIKRCSDRKPDHNTSAFGVGGFSFALNTVAMVFVTWQNTYLQLNINATLECIDRVDSRFYHV
jgi:hypothetical protein